MLAKLFLILKNSLDAPPSPVPKSPSTVPPTPPSKSKDTFTDVV